MLKVIDLVYHSHTGISDPKEVMAIHRPASGFAKYLADKIDIQFVKHMNYEGRLKDGAVDYVFFKRPNRFWQIPFTTHRYIQRQQPDIVIVEGLIFPLQLIMLKKVLSKQCRIIVQHHGEKPYKGIKKFFQKQADRFTDAYLFTAAGNAEEWIREKIIPGKEKCFEGQEASVFFEGKDKQKSREELGIGTDPLFLWVGRLNANKDPFAILNAFEKYAAANPRAKLIMVYSEDEMLGSIQQLVEHKPALKNTVTLAGRMPNEKLEDLYSAADFYLSGSHKEGSGYALMEAMACGCIPLVTNIPTFSKMTGNGEYGFLYPPGDTAALTLLLMKTGEIDIASYSEKVKKHFREKLNFKNIADDLLQVFDSVIKR